MKSGSMKEDLRGNNVSGNWASGNWPAWFEPRLPAAGECSPVHALEQREQRDPDATFVVLEDGSEWSNGDMLRKVRETAAVLAAAGLVPGDRVLLWLPNGPDMLRYLFAAWTLGLTPVPLNVSLRGAPLANVLRTADTAIMVCHPSLVARLVELDSADAAALKTIVLPDIGGSAPRDERWKLLPEAQLAGGAVATAAHLSQPWEIAAIIFSSGTTGPSKGVQAPFAQLWSLGRAFYGFLQNDDRMLLLLPLFHVAALGALFGSMAAGATVALAESFRAQDFLDVVRRTRATSVPGLGRTLIDALNKAAPSPGDRDNPLRTVLVQSVNPAVRAFSERFGCNVIASYSMTETSCISIAPINTVKDGSIGRPRSGIEVRLVDQHDIEVPVGAPGEIVVRANDPWVLNAGYFRNAQATVQAWRNGWFHTGDIARQDADGDLYYLDRSKDVIRRRSENISSVELEAAVRQHPDVQDVAAIGVETPEGEEVLVVVVPLPARAVDPEQLIRFLIPRLPHFMVPRFVRVVAELPKTQTNRVQKSELRSAGLAPGCWDREAAGIRVRRERL